MDGRDGFMSENNTAQPLISILVRTHARGRLLRCALETVRAQTVKEGYEVVVVEDGLASDYFLKQEGNKEELEKLLSEFSQKAVEVNIQVCRDERDFDANHVDLAQIIHMEIEEE